MMQRRLRQVKIGDQVIDAAEGVRRTQEDVRLALHGLHATLGVASRSRACARWSCRRPRAFRRARARRSSASRGVRRSPRTTPRASGAASDPHPARAGTCRRPTCSRMSIAAHAARRETRQQFGREVQPGRRRRHRARLRRIHRLVSRGIAGFVAAPDVRWQRDVPVPFDGRRGLARRCAAARCGYAAAWRPTISTRRSRAAIVTRRPGRNLPPGWIIAS